MAAKKKKLVLVPKNRKQLTGFVKKIRAAENAIRKIEAKNKEKVTKWETTIAKLNEKAEAKAAPYAKQIQKLAMAVWIYAEANRAELLRGKRVKRVYFPSGDFLQWYFSKWRVELLKKKNLVIAELKRKAKELLRIKEDIDKVAILSHPDKIKGLTSLKVVRDEIFAIVLATMGIELQKGKRKFKKVAV